MRQADELLDERDRTIAALKASNEAMRKALKPFAKRAGPWAQCADNSSAIITVPVSALRNADAALALALATGPTP